MNKTLLHRALVSATVLGGSLVYAATSQFRAPLAFLRYGGLHYPLEHVENMWWFEQMPHDRKDPVLRINSFNGLYGRSADQSFFDSCNPCSNKTTHKTASLSTLWFGKESFRGEDVFPGGILNNPCDEALQAQENLALSFSRISPRFEYNEFGAFCGIDVKHTFGSEKQFEVGFRASMPFMDITITPNQNCSLYETIDDVVRMRQIEHDSLVLDFAARFDFLNALTYRDNLGDCKPFVQYNQGTNSISMADFAASGTTSNNANVFAVGRVEGTIPNQPFRKDGTNSIPALPESGILGENQVAFFKNGSNYATNLQSDRDMQGTLFIVPRAGTSDDTGPLAPLAGGISGQLEGLMLQLNALGVSNPVSFFREAGDINLCGSDRITGQGDLFTEFYGGYVQPNWFIDGIIGMRFPTGVRTDKVHRVYMQSTGNNGHFELKLEVDGGWKVCNWFAFEIDFGYHHAFKHTEQRAAPYKGATVKNIGPKVGVDISWNSFTLHTNFNFFHPHNPDLGWMLGYDFYAKTKNNVCIKCPPPADLLGRANDTLPEKDQGYDMSLLSKHTNTQTHRLRSELFHRWNFCEIFAGAAQVLAGKNAMKETEAYIGVTIYF